MTKALFLDRDGVINHDSGYTNKWSSKTIITGIIDLVRKFNARGYYVCVITNQSGIGRGYFHENDFHHFMTSMIKHFKARGANIGGYYFCGCNPLEKSCKNRKPNPGMLFQASKEIGIDLKNSIFVGDKWSDMLAAERANIEEKFLYSPKGDHEHIGNDKINYRLIKSFSEIHKLIK
jgi:D-glycero-D-manno-heptose 1,7-bisphosphate phosphatase